MMSHFQPPNRRQANEPHASLKLKASGFLLGSAQVVLIFIPMQRLDLFGSAEFEMPNMTLNLGILARRAHGLLIIPRLLLSSLSRNQTASVFLGLGQTFCRPDVTRYVLTPSTRSIKAGLSPSLIEERVLAVCNSFDKVPADKLTLDSNFMKDLGLDSLDHIEIIMEIENEFWFEIPDVDAEKLLTPRDIVEHVWAVALKAERIE
ncbi:Acyl carrier protein, mitochondrial [Clonorchis sinensis]|uniref:Acyl carrier protein n=1 Tax=Clonorchis sinensis TaxID=79923 RepID=A0A8T1M4Y0_CLOSI|nr:Acyl carrier protein, mitochondrial [Clonorchis sinensis]